MRASALQHTDLASAALAAAADAVVAVNDHGVITSWNAAAEAHLGHSASEAIGQTLALIIPETHRARHMAAFRAATESAALKHEGRPARVEAVRKGGSTVAFLMSLGLELGDDGAVIGAVAVLRAEDEQPVIFVDASAAT